MGGYPGSLARRTRRRLPQTKRPYILNLERTAAWLWENERCLRGGHTNSADAGDYNKKATTMSLDNTEVVDAVGTEKDSGTVVLTIFDAWDWDDQRRHLLALQAKLNAYFGFVESGQIYEDYPTAAGKRLRIDVISRYPMPDAAVTFRDEAADVASRLDITITYRTY